MEIKIQENQNPIRGEREYLEAVNEGRSGFGKRIEKPKDVEDATVGTICAVEIQENWSQVGEECDWYEMEKAFTLRADEINSREFDLRFDDIYG